ncbi:MAG: LysM peptidoglycan-binding domain-containing protein [Elusimicrobia bacterium]|nr:LysM peptidoglycan-binding domain-containing protein [Elusimicrobiota bacterium]
MCSALLAVLLAAAASAPARAADSRVEESTQYQRVVVRPGDTLWAIAHAWLKDPAKWDEILKHNALPTADPTVALPGMTLKVPVRLIKTSLRAAHVVFQVNKVLYRRRDRPDWKDSTLSMEVFQGDTLRTLDESRARVRFLNKELLNLDANSMATIKPVADPDADVELKSGSVVAGRARVVTATARVTPRTKDTRYTASVAPDMTTRVEVLKGAAAVAAHGKEVVVPAGMGTLVPPGAEPGKPVPIDDMIELEERVQEFDSAAEAGGGIAAVPRRPPPPPQPEADAESLRADIHVLQIGQPIQGFHVVAARDRDFRQVVFDRHYEVGEAFVPTTTGLAAGAYWWRVSAIDLLGAEGRFREPRYCTVGIREEPENPQLTRLLELTSPEENAEVGETVRVAGILRDGRIHLEINGVPVKPDENGEFTLMLRTTVGGNAVHVVLSDDKGNSAHISRHVTRL